MANLDINKGYADAKSKISAYQTVKQSKEDDIRQQKEKTKASTDKRKSEVQKSINDLKKGASSKKTQIKNEIKNGQLAIIPRSGLPIATTWKLIWHKEKSPSPVAKAFMAHIIEKKEEIKSKHFE